jgi:fatty-acyl-CoA synthase
MCAVVGVPDERWSEVGRAFVVHRSLGRASGRAATSSQAPGAADGAPTEGELLGFLRARLARYKVPASVRFVAELPMSSQGKVLKRALR